MWLKDLSFERVVVEKIGISWSWISWCRVVRKAEDFLGLLVMGGF
jgi:hypothetical protein